jgi:hypothetical protein
VNRRKADEYDGRIGLIDAKNLLSVLKKQLGGMPESAIQSQRVAEVHHRWKTAVERVYGGSSGLVLDHTNAVYVMSPEASNDPAAKRVSPGKTLLVVYSDDAMVRSDIDARQEFLKMRLNEQGEHVEVFSIKASRQGMKSRHPFGDDALGGSACEGYGSQTYEKTLSADDAASLSRAAEGVGDPKLRESILKAIKANTKP